MTFIINQCSSSNNFNHQLTLIIIHLFNFSSPLSLLLGLLAFFLYYLHWGMVVRYKMWKCCSDNCVKGSDTLSRRDKSNVDDNQLDLLWIEHDDHRLLVMETYGRDPANFTVNWIWGKIEMFYGPKMWSYLKNDKWL